MSRALGVIPHQPVRNTAHIFTFTTKQARSFHGFFVFQSLTVFFLDDNTVVDTHTLQPFTVYKPTKPFNTVIELPSQTELRRLVEPGDIVHIDM